MIRKLAIRTWDSPVMMTWLNTLARMISFATVLPLVLRRFVPADISLYYLFWSVVSLQLMAGSGFLPTFARFVSYALAGAKDSDFDELGRGGKAGLADGSVDPGAFSRIVATLHRVFLVLSLATVPVMAVVGTLLLQRPVSQSADPAQAWIAWGVILATTPLTLYSNQFSSLLQGSNRIALEQRWSALFVIFGSLSGLAAMLCGGGLLALIAVNQAWQVAAFFRLRWLASRVLHDLPYQPDQAIYSPAIFRAIWPSSWKSFVGVAASNGIVSASGLLFAQRITGAPLAEFLFGLRVMGVASEVSRAPFYTKLPQFNTLRIRGELPELARLARQGMQRAYAGFLVLFFAAPIGAAVILPLIKSNISFPHTSLWCLLGLATLVERCGAMHLQVYSTTNDIIWHWMNGVTGLIWIALMLALLPLLGLQAYPVAMLLGYTSFYTWIAVKKSLRSIHQTLWSFERACALPALAGFAAGCNILTLLADTLNRP
jgi:hypothetical protein